METLGGGWTTIQRRKSGLVSFYRDWKQYKEGFGSVRGDFWLGNENIHRLSRQPTRLRVELEVSLRGWDRARGSITCRPWGMGPKVPVRACTFMMNPAFLKVTVQQRKNRLPPTRPRHKKSEAAGAHTEAELRSVHNPLSAE